MRRTLGRLADGGEEAGSLRGHGGGVGEEGGGGRRRGGGGGQKERVRDASESRSATSNRVCAVRAGRDGTEERRLSGVSTPHDLAIPRSYAPDFSHVANAPNLLSFAFWLGLFVNISCHLEMA